MSFIYYVLIWMLTYIGPAYAEIGVEQNEQDYIAEDIQRYAHNEQEVEVGELSNGKIKIFVDRDHSITAVVDKQDCSVMRKEDNTVALGFKFGGLMWGFGPEVTIGRSSGNEWKAEVQRMVAEYQELCTHFNTGRLSQEEYQDEKKYIIKRGYDYAREIKQKIQDKKDDMFKEMDQGHYISLQDSRFQNGCCIFKPRKQTNEMVVRQSPFRKMIPTNSNDCRDVGVCNRFNAHRNQYKSPRGYSSVVPDRFQGLSFDELTIIGDMEAAQRMNRGRRYNNGSWNVRIGGGW